MKRMTLSEYLAVPENYRGVWTTERWDIPDWVNPHFLECAIRWNDTLETLETRIALNMDSDTEMDDEIFFYCDTLDSLLSLADKSGEDFVIAGCFGFGVYEELL